MQALITNFLALVAHFPVISPCCSCCLPHALVCVPSCSYSRAPSCSFGYSAILVVLVAVCMFMLLSVRTYSMFNVGGKSGI